MELENKTFELWAIVELMGHQKIAGYISEQSIAGTNMLRVDVPETEKAPKFTRFVGGSGIYAINPCTEEIARMIAGNLQVKPVESWDIRAYMEKNNMVALPSPDDNGGHFDHEYNEDDH
jgi:hypothetical protein